jgi:hypothetical protein
MESAKASLSAETKEDLTLDL